MSTTAGFGLLCPRCGEFYDEATYKTDCDSITEAGQCTDCVFWDSISREEVQKLTMKIICPKCNKLADYNQDLQIVTCKHCGPHLTHCWKYNAMTADNQRTTQRFRQKLVRRK